MWFLPDWFKPDWYDVDLYNNKNESIPCTPEEMKRAVDGHFIISHSHFTSDEQIMQEGVTVKEWRKRYHELCKLRGENPSPHAGYSYDAMWTYALAFDKLLKENQSYVNDLHSEQTYNKLIKIISESNFNGVRTYDEN